MKKYVKYMGNAVCALSILFVVWALWQMDFDFRQVKDWRMFGAVCIAGIILKTVTVFLSASAWFLWLEFFAGRRCGRTEALRVYAKANIGKYLPGNVMHYAGRNLFAGRLHLSQKQIAAATLGEIAGLVLSASGMGAVLAYSEMRKACGEVIQNLQASWAEVMQKLQGLWETDMHPLSVDAENTGNGMFYTEQLSAAAVILAVLLTVTVLAAVFFVCIVKKNRHNSKNLCKPRVRQSFLGKNQMKGFIKTMLSVCLIYASVLMILGLIFVFLYWYWEGSLQGTQVRMILAAYIISWVFGFAVPGAPGGIGVREMALTLLLSPVIGRDVTAVLSVLHRMITIIGDFAAYLLQKRLKDGMK